MFLITSIVVVLSGLGIYLRDNKSLIKDTPLDVLNNQSFKYTNTFPVFLLLLILNNGPKSLKNPLISLAFLVSTKLVVFPVGNGNYIDISSSFNVLRPAYGDHKGRLPLRSIS
jgi:hypothetical protein